MQAAKCFKLNRSQHLKVIRPLVVDAGGRDGGSNMSKKPVLVDLEKLRALIAGLDLGDAQWNEYIEARWLTYVAWWDARAANAKRKYFALRSAVVIAGALIPALVGLRELKVWGEHAWVFAVASILASLVVAICAGVENLFSFGDIWREKRAAAELIKSEGFSFLQMTGDYKDYTAHKDALKRFAANVEHLIRNEIKDYIVAVAPKKPDQPPDNRGAQPQNT